MTTKKIIYEYLKESPVSWAIIRTIECELLTHAPFKGKILDVGCGTGFFAKVLLKNLKKKRFDTGIDLSEREIADAKKSGVYNKLVAGSILNPPFRNNSFDTVFSNGVLEHIERIDKALKEISRVLKRNGHLIITVPAKYFTEYLLLGQVEGYGKFVNKLFKHYNLFDHKKWEKKLGKFGLEMIEYNYYNPPAQVKIHELFMYLAFPSYILKKITNKWILCPKVREKFLPPLTSLVSKIYTNETSKEKGGSLIIVAKKK